MTCRRLPHLDVIGQAQFITFRLKNSLPANRPFPAASLTSEAAFLCMDRLLDQGHCGPAFLAQPPIAQAVLSSIQCGVEIGHFDLHAWVIMPNHVHLLVTPKVKLSKLLGSMKAASAKHANLLLFQTGQPFWQDESYDHLVRTGDQFRSIQRYIESNPVTACLAATPEKYQWSSAFLESNPETPE